MLDTDARAKLRSLLPQVLARRLNEAGANWAQPPTAYTYTCYRSSTWSPWATGSSSTPRAPSATKSWATLTWPSPGMRCRLTTYRKMALYASCPD